MKYISAKNSELIGFFEQELRLLDAALPWFYNNSFYEVAQGEKSSECRNLALHMYSTRLQLKNCRFARYYLT